VAFFLAAAIAPQRGDNYRFVIRTPAGDEAVVFPAGGPAQGDPATTLGRIRERGRLGAFLADRVVRIRLLPEGETARRFTEGFTTNAPRALFLLVPFLALLLKAAYSRRFYAEHLVVALHAQTIGFLAFVPGALSGWTPLTLAGVIALAWWTFLALRRLHGEGWIRTAFKLAGIGAAFVLALGGVLMMVATLALLSI